MKLNLCKPARYFPLMHGKYDVAAGLKPLNTPMGNGPQDAHIFQIDEHFDHERTIKLEARSERIHKYYPEHVSFSEEAKSAVIQFMIKRLNADHPELFDLIPGADGFVWHCHHTHEKIYLNDNFHLLKAESLVSPPYRDAFDAVACQIQEDLSVFARDLPSSREWLAAIHLCFPNHWAAEDKIGQPFNVIHQPVADFDRLAKAKDGLVQMMIEKGPFVRFAWGLATDRELNHHPKNRFHGRSFDSAHPQLFLRIERQTLSPFPLVQASLFTIRTRFLDCQSELSTPERAALISAIESMSPEALIYKGLSRNKSEVLRWIRSLD